MFLKAILLFGMLLFAIVYLNKQDKRNTNMENIIEKKRRSVKLTPDEKKAFKKLMNTYDLKIEAAEAIGVTRQVLDLVLIKGSGSPETIDRIRKAIAA